MSTSNYQDHVGDSIVSIDQGIGEIIAVETMGKNGEFYQVIFPKTNAKNFIAVNNPNFRIISSEQEVNEAIEIFKKDHKPAEFESVKDKIQFYNNELKASDLKELAQHLSILNQEDELHSTIQKSYDRALSSVLQEIQFVFRTTKQNALKMLGLKS